MITTLDMLWKGLGIGVIISAPMGPVGMLCIQKTIAKGRRAGLLTGCGAALSDLIYCLLTGFGLSLIEDFLERNQSVIQLLGSFVLLFFGIYLYRQKQPKEYAQRAVARASVGKDGVGGFLFTLSNPLIIFLIIGLFARFNFMSVNMKFYHYIAGYVAILAGALGWWWFITFTIDKLRAHFNKQVQMWVNRIIGIVIMIFAIVGIVSSSSDLFAASTPPPSFAVQGETYLSDVRLTGTGVSDKSTNSITLSLPDTASPCRVLFHVAAPERNFSADKIFKGLIHSSKPRAFWRMKLTGEDESCGEINIECGTNEHDASSFHPAGTGSFITVRFPDGDTKHFSAPQCDFNAANVIILNLNDEGLTLSGGTGGTKPILDLPASALPFTPTALTVSNLTREDMSIPYLSVRIAEGYEGKALGRIFVSHIDSIASCKDESCRSALNGYWKLLNAEYDPELSFPGGDYTLRITSPCQDVHIMEYQGGATKQPANWEPGRIKGALFDHEMTDNYYLYWIDSEGGLMHRNLAATLNRETGTLQLRFPLLGATLTFTRIPDPE